MHRRRNGVKFRPPELRRSGPGAVLRLREERRASRTEPNRTEPKGGQAGPSPPASNEDLAMEQDSPIVNLAELALEQYGKGGHFAAMLGRVGAKLGTRQIGCTLVVLEPGKRAWPYHLHYAEEELFVVLEGEGTLRYNDGEFPVRAGDVILTPPGPGTAHQIINTSERELRYLALSGKRRPEVCHLSGLRQVRRVLRRAQGRRIHRQAIERGRLLGRRSRRWFSDCPTRERFLTRPQRPKALALAGDPRLRRRCSRTHAVARHR